MAKHIVKPALNEVASPLQTIADAMMNFMENGNLQQASTPILLSALSQTASEYGFVGVALDGPVLRILTHEGFVWDETTNREMYEEVMHSLDARGYADFAKLDNLFGMVITDKQVVISNAPATDTRGCGGVPPGHPRLNNSHR